MSRSNGHVVVIGAGHAGGTLVAHLRREGFTGRITLVGSEEHVPYHRPPLSKSFGQEAEEPKWLHDPSFYEEQDVELRLSQTCLSIDKSTRRVILSGGGDLEYDWLVLATGAAARELDLPGQSLTGILTLRDLADARHLEQACSSKRPWAVIGGGYIGLEVAAAAQARGVEVVVLEREDRLLARVASPTLASRLAEKHRNHGTTMRTGVQTTHFVCDMGRVGGVGLSNGDVVPCGTALVGVGAVPRIGLAQRAGLDCADGIVVDHRCRTSDEAILAIGDVASRPFAGRSDTGRMRFESIPAAVDQARHAVDTILGRPGEEDGVPWFWSDQFDLKIKIAGVLDGHYETIERSDPTTGSMAFYHLRQDRLVAAETINAPKDFMVAKRMLATGCAIDRAALESPQTRLQSLVPA